ncbi:ATP-dependent DNA helicase [Cutibacterium acnes JCM 18918]|nr:ATP-dependent DNA helicase [Cutibacterium acnes JCM 18918]
MAYPHPEGASSSLAEAVGAKTAKAFSALHVGTVGEALGHLPRRYLTGTETTDLSHLVIDTEVALVADVVGVEVHTNKTVTGRERRPRQRLEVMLSDGKARLPVTFFGKPHIVSYWQRIFFGPYSRHLCRQGGGVPREPAARPPRLRHD